ncbi:2-oxo-3-hexenedioate decarboxylase [Phenylobacterium immobile]|uniref:2-oxo-3-hexenedioate decarboxylase n=1 Tax=Phenylobacterium immobile TaxID=21 RepID=UPI000AE1E70D|nr:2-oxo-3-hexenedioate decarboxylase [Phenylobacterium immobile]
MLTVAEIETLAERVDDAERKARAITKITDDFPTMTWEDAYAVQDRLRQRKLGRGEQVGGLKMGFTSLAKMEQMGVHEPIHGFVTAHGRLNEGDTLSCAGLIHPRVEAEIAFVLKSELVGPDCDIAAVIAATDYVTPALEVIDSRYENFRFDLTSVIADNTSAARYVVGKARHSLAGLDRVNLEVVVEKNGAVVARDTGAAVMGDPAQAVAALANMLARTGKTIPAGTLVMTGGVTEAVGVAPGDRLVVRYAGWGDLVLNIAA